MKSKKNLTLPQWIQKTGVVKAADMLGVSTLTVYSWKNRKKYPRVEKSWEIVKLTPVDYKGIYGPK